MDTHRAHFSESILGKGILNIFNLLSKYTSVELSPIHLCELFLMLFLFSPCGTSWSNTDILQSLKIVLSKLRLIVLCIKHLTLKVGLGSTFLPPQCSLLHLSHSSPLDIAITYFSRCDFHHNTDVHNIFYYFFAF